MQAAQEEEFVARLLLADRLLARILLELLPAECFQRFTLLACMLISTDLLFHFALQFGKLAE